MDVPGAVLFACTHNAIRSPMAEAIMKYLHGHQTYVDSVGVRSNEPLDPFAVAALEEIGIDLSRHRPKTFDDLEDGSFDVVITLSPEAQHSAIEMTRTTACEVEYWPTFDPSLTEGSRDVRMEAYRAVRDELMRRIKQKFPVQKMPNA